MRYLAHVPENRLREPAAGQCGVRWTSAHRRAGVRYASRDDHSCRETAVHTHEGWRTRFVLGRAAHRRASTARQRKRITGRSAAARQPRRGSARKAGRRQLGRTEQWLRRTPRGGHRAPEGRNAESLIGPAPAALRPTPRRNTHFAPNPRRIDDRHLIVAAKLAGANSGGTLAKTASVSAHTCEGRSQGGRAGRRGLGSLMGRCLPTARPNGTPDRRQGGLPQSGTGMTKCRLRSGLRWKCWQRRREMRDAETCAWGAGNMSAAPPCCSAAAKASEMATEMVDSMIPDGPVGTHNSTTGHHGRERRQEIRNQRRCGPLALARADGRAVRSQGAQGRDPAVPSPRRRRSYFRCRRVSQQETARRHPGCGGVRQNG